MKLTDALAQFETRISKSEGGVVTMGAEDLVKYIGEQLALAESEGDAGKERREAVKAVIAATKAAEAAGATSFEVKVFAASVAQKAAEGEKDPVLDALGSLTATVESLKTAVKAVTVPAPKEEQPASTSSADVNKADGEQNASTPKAGSENEVEKNAQARVRWPLDLNPPSARR